MCLQDITAHAPGASRGRDPYFITNYKKKGRRGRHLWQAPEGAAKTVHNQNTHASYMYTDHIPQGGKLGKQKGPASQRF